MPGSYSIPFGTTGRHSASADRLGGRSERTDVIVVHGTPAWRDTGLAGPVLTIGNFDGVHRGHRTLLDATRRAASDLARPAVALTFDPAPRDVLRPDNGIPRIQSMARKLVHLERAGLDAVVVQPFDLALAALEPGMFARRVLSGDLNVGALVVGHDFRFGHGRAGTADTLRDLGVPVHVVPPLVDEEGIVSSSRIRKLLLAGDVAGAARLLGHAHEVEGVVVEGERRGRTLGFPTANLDVRGGLLPADGVYAVHMLDRPGVANLGTRPTFAGMSRRLEVHLLDFSGDLYGRPVVVTFVARIRGEQRFESIDALRQAIAADAEAARRIVSAP
jgi:riboflavin kinase/FMN adenylyltransferase